MTGNTGERMMDKDATLPEIAEWRVVISDDMPRVPFQRDPLREPIDAVLEGVLDLLREDDEFSE
jgi:hypothetical protein